MTNFNFQGKIIRHFWGKLIRQSTVKKYENGVFTICYLGGGSLVNISNKITFFHSVKRIE